MAPAFLRSISFPDTKVPLIVNGNEEAPYLFELRKGWGTSSNKRFTLVSIQL